MSVGTLDATIAVLEAKRIPYQVATSPHTGRLTAYTNALSATTTYGISSVTDVQLRDYISTNLPIRGVDGWCESVSYIGGNFTGHYYADLRVATTATAEGNLALLGTDGQIASASLLLSALYIILAIVAVIFVSICAFADLFGPQNYNWNTADGRQMSGTLDQMTTQRNEEYWYVCGKDPSVVAGPKSLYPESSGGRSSVPQSEVTAFNEACASARTLSSGGFNLFGGGFEGIIMWILIAAAGIAGIYILAKVGPTAISRKIDRPEERSVSSIDRINFGALQK